MGTTRSKRPTRHPYGGKISLTQAARIAARMAAQHALYKTLTKEEKRPSDNSPLTGQYDYKTDYRKRRIPKRKRYIYKRRRRFTRRVMQIVNKGNTGSVHLVRRSLGVLTSLANTTAMAGYGLCGLDGGSSTQFNTCNDIAEFLKAKDATSWSNWNVQANTSINYKLFVQHAVMDITIRNNGSTDAIIEVYYIRGRSVLPNSFSSPSPADVYVDGFNRQAKAQDPDSGATYSFELAAATVGVTPFQCNWFCKNYLIYKRQKYRVPPANEVNFSIHTRSRWFDVSNTKNRVTDGRYHGVLFQQYGSPNGTGSTSIAEATSVNYLCVRRYTCRFIPNKPPADALQA